MTDIVSRYTGRYDKNSVLYGWDKNFLFSSCDDNKHDNYCDPYWSKHIQVTQARNK